MKKEEEMKQEIKEEMDVIDPKDLSISKVRTGEILRSLQTTSDVVAGGKDYNKDQVKNMTNISNAMVKVLRFEFDVSKYFNSKMPM